MRIIISGGGSGGHIFPAIAIADEIKKRNPESSILFIGAEGKMEMQKIPKAGYEIKGLSVRGFQRKLTLENFSVLFKLMASLRMARKIVKDFKPDIAIGVGGYASGPAMRAVAKAKLPYLLQEQNSYAGLTNKLLAKRASKICVAYLNLESFFPKEKLVLTGNPVRDDIINSKEEKQASIAHYGLSSGKKTILLFGGSQGAGTLNEAMKNSLDLIKLHTDINFIWQAGSYYFDKYKDCEVAKLDNVAIMPFIDRMDKAYAAADLVICRAGALTISELQVLGKPSILVPSPNVAEDHQTKNALSLVRASAAEMIKDDEAKEELIKRGIQLIGDEETLSTLSFAVAKMALPNAAEKIVDEIEKCIM